MPNVADRRQGRRNLTLGDFMPRGEVANKLQRDRRQRLTLRLGGTEGGLNSRVPLWSTRDRLKEMPAVPEEPPLRMREVQLGHEGILTCSLNLALPTPRKRRRRIFAGLLGIVNNHFPTYTALPYRSWAQRPHGLAASTRPLRPIAPPPWHPPAGDRQYAQEQAKVQQPLPPVRRAPSTPRGPLPRTTSTAATPVSRGPPAQVPARMHQAAPPVRRAPSTLRVPLPPPTSNVAPLPPATRRPRLLRPSPRNPPGSSVLRQPDATSRDREELTRDREELTPSSPVTASPAEKEAERLQLIVEIGGKTTVAQAQATD